MGILYMILTIIVIGGCSYFSYYLVRYARSEEGRKAAAEFREQEEQKKQQEEAFQRALALAMYESSKDDYTGDIPAICPSCKSNNKDYRIGGQQWILESTQIVDETKFDGATRIMGSTTIHTKNQQKKIRTFRCPKCGYKITR